MTGFKLQKNITFNWDGVAVRIDSLPPNGQVLIEQVNTGALSIVTRQEILTAYSSGRAVAKSPTEESERVPAPYSRPLDELPEQIRNEVKRRMAYLKAILEEGRPLFSADYLQPIVAEISGRLGDSHPPSITTVWRWYRRYWVNQDSRSLIPRLDRRGTRKSRQPKVVLQMASEAIEEAFKASPRATGSTIYARLERKIEVANRQLCEDSKLAVPTLRTLYRIVERMDAYDKAVLREGTSAAEKKFRLVKRTMRTSDILERVEIDHTPLDLFLVDEKTGMSLGRPTLTVVLDHYSRMLLGYYLSYNGPSLASLVGALRHAVLPKQTYCGPISHLKIQHDWPCYGRPKQMVVDNGFEFHSHALEAIALDIGSDLTFCPKYEPRFKGPVERFLKTVNYSFAHQLPGTSFARFFQRGDYDSQKHAILTFAEFNQLFQKWVLDVYAQTIHRGTQRTPWALWHEGMQRVEPELPSAVEILEQRIGEFKEPTLRHDGVVINGIRYNGPSLQPILNAYGPGVRVRAMFNSEDLGQISVWGPDSSEPVQVLATNQEHARGLTAKQNEFIRAEIRERGKSDQNPRALAEAKQSLIQATQELTNSQKQRDRSRAAKLRGLNSNTPQPKLETPPSISHPRGSERLPKHKTNHLRSPRDDAPSIPIYRLYDPSKDKDASK